MARGKSHKNGTREPSDSLTLRVALPGVKSPASRNLLSQVEDFRKFDFEPATRPARLFSGAPAKFSVSATPIKKSRAPGRQAKQRVQMAFTAPRETIVCIRRSTRKEVLFAKKKTGKRGQRKARWSAWSRYKC